MRMKFALIAMTTHLSAGVSKKLASGPATTNGHEESDDADDRCERVHFGELAPRSSRIAITVVPRPASLTRSRKPK